MEAIRTEYSNLYDVTSGSNGRCTVAYLCTAVAGYDGPTGLGTPNGIAPSGSEDRRGRLDFAGGHPPAVTHEGDRRGWRFAKPFGDV